MWVETSPGDVAFSPNNGQAYFAFVLGEDKESNNDVRVAMDLD